MAKTFLVGPLAAALLLGCGGDDDDQAQEAYTQKCDQVCQLQADGGCDLLGTEICVQFCYIGASAASACRNAIEATMDCQIAGGSEAACSSDACSAETSAQEAACN